MACIFHYAMSHMPWRKKYQIIIKCRLDEEKYQTDIICEPRLLIIYFQYDTFIATPNPFVIYEK